VIGVVAAASRLGAGGDGGVDGVYDGTGGVSCDLELRVGSRGLDAALRALVVDSEGLPEQGMPSME
jgi:hypothetical protein